MRTFNMVIEMEVEKDLSEDTVKDMVKTTLNRYFGEKCDIKDVKVKVIRK